MEGHLVTSGDLQAPFHGFGATGKQHCSSYQAPGGSPPHSPSRYQECRYLPTPVVSFHDCMLEFESNCEPAIEDECMALHQLQIVVVSWMCRRCHRRYLNTYLSSNRVLQGC